MEKFNDTKLEDTLSSLKSPLDSEWSISVEENLKKFTLNEQKEYTKFNIFTHFFMKNKLIVASVIFIALLVVGLSALSIYLLNRSAGFSKEDTIAILAKVLEKNAVSTVQESAGLTTSADMASPRSSLTIAPYYDDFEGNNYRYTKTVNTSGPAIDRCSDSYFRSFDGINESFEFRPNGGTDYQEYLYKYISSTLDNQITGYSLSYTENRESIYYDYAGGSYGVKNIYELGPENSEIERFVAEDSVGTTTDETSTPEEVTEPDAATLVAQYFGPDAQIVGTEQAEGKTYYILQYSYDFQCSDSLTKIVYENKINQETFEISDTKTYVGSADGANLINTSVVVNELKTITQAEADAIFSFDINVPVREVRYPYVASEAYSAENEVSKVLNVLKTNAIKVLVPVSGYTLSYGYALNEVDTAPAGSDYREDRNFYPAGALGDELFSPYNPALQPTYLSSQSNWVFANADTSKSSLSFESFATGTTREQIIASKTESFTDVSQQSTSNVNIVIDGVNHPATLLQFIGEQNYLVLKGAEESTTSSESRLIDPNTGVVPQTYYYIIFEYSGHFYVVYKDLYLGESLSASDIALKSYDPNVAADSEFLTSELLDAYQPIPVEPGIGGTEPGSPGSGIACTQEAMQCPDGSYVGRNSDLSCEFDPCP